MKPLFRSSAMPRILNCNGSIRLVPLVKEREGDEGYEGTMVHWMIADRAIRELGAIFEGGELPPPAVPKGYKLPAFSSWLVDWGIRYLKNNVPADWSLMVEVEMEWEFGSWVNRGHADWLAFSPDGTKAKGGDWKTGRDPVEPAESNEQINDYSVLTKLNWPSIQECDFVICQPRVNEEDGFERVSRIVLGPDRIELAAPTLDARVIAAMANDMELNSSRTACRWCPVGLQCPVLQEIKRQMKLKLTPAAIAKIKHKPDDATLADWVIESRVIAQPIKDATELLHGRLADGKTITSSEGVQVSQKLQNGDYTIPDPVAFLQAVRTLLPEDSAIAKTFTPSMTRLKDVIAETMNINKTGQAPVTAESVFDAHLRPLTEQGKKRLFIFQ